MKLFGWRQAPRKYLMFWNAVDWISIVISVIIVVLYAALACLFARGLMVSRRMASSKTKNDEVRELRVQLAAMDENA